MLLSSAIFTYCLNLTIGIQPFMHAYGIATTERTRITQLATINIIRLPFACFLVGRIRTVLHDIADMRFPFASFHSFGI